MEAEEPSKESRLTRRRLLQDAGIVGVALLGGGALGAGRGLAALAGAGSALALTPEQEEGPYYVAIERIRQDVRLGRKGVPLHLQFKVVNATTGKPIAGAACDIWQCDATGSYSDESQLGTSGQTWLRGVQLTDAHGVASFLTIYPGHYQGRATHIHVKVHVDGRVRGTRYTGGHVSHTGQLFFDDAISTQVYALAPYTSDLAPRVPDADDQVYTEQGGAKSMLKLTKLGSSIAAGFRGSIVLGVNPGSSPTPVGVTGTPAGVNGVTTPGQAQVNPTPGPGPGQ